LKSENFRIPPRTNSAQGIVGRPKVYSGRNRGSYSGANRKPEYCLLTGPLARVIQNRKVKTVWLCLLEQRLIYRSLVY